MDIVVMRHSGYWNAPLWSMGHNYLLVQVGSASDPLPKSVADRYEAVYYIPSWDSLGELAAIAADITTRGRVVEAVASPTEHTQYAAGYLSALLNLAHPQNSVILHSRDKRVMKSAARAAGIRTAGFVAVHASAPAAEIARAAAGIGYPLIVKPASGFGAVATRLVKDERGLFAAFAAELDPDLPSPDMVLEEFVDADEFHIDALWRDGEAWVFAVSRYVTSPLRLKDGSGLQLSILLDPVDHRFLYAAALDLHLCLNEQIGISRGATHLEFFREPSGDLIFSEVATRVGGGNISNMIAAHCGVDMRTAYYHELLSGRREDLPWQTPTYRYLGMLNIRPAHGGTVTALPSSAELLAFPGVIDVSIAASVGDGFAVGITSSSWVVVVILGGATEEEVEVLAGRLCEEFPVLVDPLPNG